VPRKILFDTDPGVDDAMALLFALRSPELEVVGVTTVYGNAQVEQTTLNALRVLEVAGRTDIPVASGAARPLVRAYRGKRSHIHGEDALGNTFLPPPSTRPLDIAAAEFIVRTALAQPGELTLVAVGPLTNLALAARLEPRVVSAVRQVIVMGGAAFVPGRVSPVPDVNVDNDPEVERLPVFVETAGRRAGQTVPDPFGGVYAERSRSARGERFRQRGEIPEIDVCVDVDSARLLALFEERMQKPHPRP
jgi:inosine-uridine nucleoside N-ribohydrolase